jgi:succinate dehydrogenase/fumarate reductase flavoprotein subunit
MTTTVETDVLIIGGGISGLSAGIVCSQNGLRTLLVEKSSQLGGPAALSAGMFWAPRDVAYAHSTIPFGNQALQEAFISEHAQAVQWMRDNGVAVSPAFHGIMSIGVGYPIDIKAFISKVTAIISKNRDS